MTKDRTAKDLSSEITPLAPPEEKNITENSIVSLAKAKFEKGDRVAQSPRPEKQHNDEKRPVSTSSGDTIPMMKSAKISPTDNLSVVEKAKAKFENTNLVTKPNEPTRQHTDYKLPMPSGAVQKVLADTASTKDIGEKISKEVFEAQTEAQKRRQRRINSIGPSQPVIEELEETLGITDEKASVVAETKAEECVAKSGAQSITNPSLQNGNESTLKPLRPSLKDTPFVRAKTGTSFENAAAEATAYLEGSTVNNSGRDISKVEESTLEVVVSNEVTKDSLVDPQAKAVANNEVKSKPQQSSPIDNPASAMASVKDRILKFSPGTDNANTISGRINSTILKPFGTDNTNGKACIKNRIQKFQPTGEENAHATDFQMIGIQTLGLAGSKDKPKADSAKNDDCSASTTYSFFCSNDEASEDEDDESREDSSMGEYESIHVIGPDLTPIEIPISSDSERVGSIKEAVAKASGIPVEELRLAIQSEDSDIEESHRISLDDDYELSPGDILAVQPSTVVVKLPDGGSKLELSVFPGTIISDIKEYIAENTGTDPSRHLLYDFEKNFNDELEDETPITTDCILRLTLY